MSDPSLAETLALGLVVVAGSYLGLGLLFAITFVVRGVGQIDPQASHGTWGFRWLILPGCVAFWPLLAARWRRGSPPPIERNPHRDRAAARSGTSVVES